MSSSSVIVACSSCNTIPETSSVKTRSAVPVLAAMAIAAKGKGDCFGEQVRDGGMVVGGNRNGK